MNVKNKIGLVTGGSRGLGRDMAINLAKIGIDVIVTYYSNETAANTVGNEIKGMGRKFIAIQLDSINNKTFDEFIRTLSVKLRSKFDQTHFDFLINNAGTGLYKPFAETTEDEFDIMLNIHFKGVYF